MRIGMNRKNVGYIRNERFSFIELIEALCAVKTASA
jgi:hypothetical protein